MLSEAKIFSFFKAQVWQEALYKWQRKPRHLRSLAALGNVKQLPFLHIGLEISSDQLE